MMPASLNGQIEEYTRLLREGSIDQAYRAILAVMTALKSDLENCHPDHKTGALYQGMMDMTYFASTPPSLQVKKLKTALVYLHRENRFEAWLGGVNRSVQADWIHQLADQEVAPYQLSTVSPGVDSILEWILVEAPNFEDPLGLRAKLRFGLEEFIADMERITDKK